MNVPGSVRNGVLALALFFPAIVGTGTGVATETGCSPHDVREAKDAAKDALTVAQILCIAASPFMDSESVAKACGLLQEQKPALDALLSQKRAAQRAGACGPEKDAGKD